MGQLRFSAAVQAAVSTLITTKTINETTFSINSSLSSSDLPSTSYHHHIETHLTPQYIVDTANNNDNNSANNLPLGYTIVEVAVAILAFFGNLLAIIVFIQDRRLRKVTNFYIVSLSLADLLVGLVGVPSAISTRIGLPRNAFTGCLTMLSLLVVLCTISILNLVAVSLDRLWAILYPLNYHSRMSSSAARIIIITCWIIGALVGFLPLFGWNNGPHHSNDCFFVSIMDYDFLVFLFFATIVFPALIMFFAYLRIYFVVVRTSTLFDKNSSRKSSNNLLNNNSINNNHTHLNLHHNNHKCNNNNHHHQQQQQQQQQLHEYHRPNSLNTGKSGSCRSENSLMISKIPLKCDSLVTNSSTESYDQRKVTSTSYHRREVKKARKLAIIVMFFMLCWIPLYLNNTLEAFFNLRQPAWLVDTFIVLSHLNSAVNPILYAYHMKDFRESMKLLLCRCIFKPTGLRDHRRQELIIVSGKQLNHHSQQTQQPKQSTSNHQQSSPLSHLNQSDSIAKHFIDNSSWAQSTNTSRTSPEHELVNSLHRY